MEILQSNLHPQPQEQLEQVAQGCGQLDFKCLHGWRLCTSRDMLQHLIKITVEKKKPFLILHGISCISVHAHSLVPPLDTTDANLSTGIIYLHGQQGHQSSPAQKGLGAFIRESSKCILNRAIINLLPDSKVRKIIHLCSYWLSNRQEKFSDLI